MKRMWENLKESRAFYCLIGLVILCVVASIISPTFRTFNNLITILRQASILLILSIGLTAVLLEGNVDLSVGATSALVGCICAQLLKLGVSIGAVFVIGMLLGGVIGALNGFLVSVIGLPSFIATYATNSLVEGLAICIMAGAVIYDLPSQFTWFGIGYVGPIPVIIIIALVVTVFFYILLEKTTFGRDIFSYGSNKDAARFSGINMYKTSFSAFILCSVFAGLGGVLMTARLNAAEASMGDAYGLQTVAAVVVGGTSMMGGEGGALGTAIGAIMLTVIVNIMNLIGISSNAQSGVVGFVIICMVLIDAISRGRQERSNSVKTHRLQAKEAM